MPWPECSSSFYQLCLIDFVEVLNRFSVCIEDISTASVLEAVTQSADTLRACQRHLARFHMMDLSLASLHTECSTIRFQLNRIGKLIYRDRERFEADILEEYQCLLEACSISFFVLNKHFEALNLTQAGNMAQQTLVDQVKLLWEHQQIDIVSKSIISQARAIGVLFHAFASFVVHHYISMRANSDNAQGKSRTSFGNHAKPRGTRCPRECFQRRYVSP